MKTRGWRLPDDFGTGRVLREAATQDKLNTSHNVALPLPRPQTLERPCGSGKRGGLQELDKSQLCKLSDYRVLSLGFSLL